MTNASEMIELLKNLHDSYAVYRQRVVISDNRVIYSFLLRGPVATDTGFQWYFTEETSKQHIKDVSRGFASAIKVLHSDISIKVLPEVGQEDLIRKIEINYTPKTEKGLNKILEYLRTVPVEGGTLPSKDAFSFCY